MNLYERIYCRQGHRDTNLQGLTLRERPMQHKHAEQKFERKHTNQDKQANIDRFDNGVYTRIQLLTAASHSVVAVVTETSAMDEDDVGNDQQKQRPRDQAVSRRSTGRPACDRQRPGQHT